MQYTLNDLPTIAKSLLDRYPAGTIYTLEGNLGAGKTTLVAEMARQLGVTEPTSSPTFSIVNEYAAADGPIYHLDAYRLGDVEEALAAGIEETVHADAVAIFIEWPAVLEPLLPPGVVHLRLEHAADGQSRTLTITTDQ
ncbi:tRNA (adenosine(37)-N6)-threonylcarbamoyltransferase complex ATPase subunit type 1 TsaE [Lewinella sp. 4G2]|uniref:tRNA (adenosine(37)-N6)-threonylcarbamoyltransferase complex ATPase subunit type 1 TsaE n=1 Tax=Lewinella sp. 4G2 TaxID=1803372 RepID=UPI0007B46F2B|nr:tRNA (adenosine(37)-N6)-threonylcarbamoyltransferase complex ATPase subunit type 1 TsaE [Lewinella sp. 4G2]OAV43659.1 tRNA (N6-adenosine(37)-N6)-threonylcarbamoyltransferase complex ATPase TsaE [Lewinella sp. 4G2]